MLDHILCYASASDRPAGPLDEVGQPLGLSSWEDDAGRTWMPVRCIITDAIYDDAGGLVSAAAEAPGVWMVVRTVRRDQDLEADDRCLIVSDSDRAAAGLPFVFLSKLQPDTILGRIDPVFAGDNYPFPTGPASNLVPLMIS